MSKRFVVMAIAIDEPTAKFMVASMKLTRLVTAAEVLELEGDDVFVRLSDVEAVLEKAADKVLGSLDSKPVGN